MLIATHSKNRLNISLFVLVFPLIFIFSICAATSSGNYYNKGVTLGAEGKFLAAKEALQQALEIDPHDSSCAVGLTIIEDLQLNKIKKISAIYLFNGTLYANKGLVDDAIIQYNKAISVNPNCEIGYNEKGRAYHAKGNYDKAIADFNKALNINSSFVYAYLNRGISFQLKGDYNLAILDYNKAIELNPRLLEAYICRGAGYSEMGHYDQALSDYNKAIDINPNSSVAYYNRGNTLFLGKKDFQNAVISFSIAIRIKPDFALAYHNRGAAYISLKDRKKGCADWKYACELGECKYYQKARDVWKCCK